MVKLVWENKTKIKKAKKLWITYLSVAVVVCAIGGLAYACSRMDKSNNKTGDETTGTTVTRETSKTTEIVTSATENKAIVTVTSASETKISETLKTEETQTDSQVNVEKYSWFKQPVYEFQDVLPIIEAAKYILNDNMEYCDAFKVKKDGKYGLIDSEGDIKQEIIYDEIESGFFYGDKGYDMTINGNVLTVDFDYQPASKFIGGPTVLEFCWDTNENKAVKHLRAELSLDIEAITDDRVYVVEYVEKNPNITNVENGALDYYSYLKLGHLHYVKRIEYLHKKVIHQQQI